MHILSVLISILLARISTSAPTTRATDQAIDSWALENNTIVCDAKECNYTFTIHEAHTGIKSSCIFRVHGPSKTPFQMAECNDTNRYLIDGGYTEAGVVLNFKNEPEDLWAFFGYDLQEFVSGPIKYSPAYHIGTWDKRSVAPGVEGGPCKLAALADGSSVEVSGFDALGKRLC